MLKVTSATPSAFVLAVPEAGVKTPNEESDKEKVTTLFATE
ncbi:hypothetical protein ACNH6B_11955 [Shewanella basaltis]